MTFCSLSEAWGQGPDGIETGKYQPVNYEDSNIYKNSGEPVFDTTIEKQPVKRIPNMSRTQERLPQHNGPSNRYSENIKNVSINYDDNNNISADDAETPFNKKNNELPISQYSKFLKAKNHRKESVPVHEIKLKYKKCRRNEPKDKEEDLNDTIDNIINKVDNNSETSNDNISNSSSSSTASSEDKPVPIITKFKELTKKYKNKNDIIKYLILQNEKLTKLIKKRSMLEKSKGIFSQWDLLIVVCLGILMIIVLEYVYKIAISKN
jgi:hypothetical protein